MKGTAFLVFAYAALAGLVFYAFLCYESGRGLVSF